MRICRSESDVVSRKPSRERRQLDVLALADWRPHLGRFTPLGIKDDQSFDHSGKSGDKGARKGAETRKV